MFLLIRSLTSFKLCALCASVFSSWIILLVFYYLNYEVSPVLIGILIGGSVVGGMYLLEEKLPNKYSLFKLPYFLTLLSFSYFLLDKKINYDVSLILGILWLIFIAIFLSKNNQKVSVLSKKIIECCKNW
ncbi:MAG: hypothetical protein WDZ80_02745 [Candidatus Paceibacterota bacterium]